MRPLPLTALALFTLIQAGCANPFRAHPVIMYRDGWGGVNTVAESPYQAMPYGASMPAQNADNRYPEAWTSGWYVGDDQQWRAQRWVRLGTDQAGNPTYIATYP